MLCREDAGECDVPEYCDAAGACPANGFEPTGTACGDPSDTICDDPDTCDSTGACQVNHEPITTLCREDAGECDLEEYCDGAGSCPADTFEDCTEWCGLTQGFWKENTNKYLSAWTSGRQVCDQYFENTAPSDVCNVISSSPCSCGSDPTCENWGCIYEVFSKAKPKDMTKIQMMALYMTQEYHVTGTEEPFYIDCTKFQEECSASLPTDICGEGDKAASIIDIWTYLQSIDDTQPSTAASLANCLNNYNDAQCSDTVEYPDCESVTDPATFDGLPGCGFGTKQVKIMLN
jgi:hypothetical protein